jgi:hypothetical protein
MQEVLAFAILMVFGSVYTVATLAWIAAVFFLLKTIGNRRPGVLLWGAPLGYFPPNIVFRPDLLTDRGQFFRRRFGQAALVFVTAVVMGLALDGLLRVLSQ